MQAFLILMSTMQLIVCPWMTFSPLILSHSVAFFNEFFVAMPIDRIDNARYSFERRLYDVLVHVPNNQFSAIESIIHRLGSIAALFKSFCCSFPIVHFWFIQNLAIGIMTSSYSTRRPQEQGCGADNNTFLSLRDLASVLSADLSISVIPQDKYEPKLPGRQENKFVTAHLKTEIDW